MSFSFSVNSLKGTSVRTPISRHTSVIKDHIRVFQGATAPSSMVRDSSGTRVFKSTVRTVPVPLQVRQAPWLLKCQFLCRRSEKAGCRIQGRPVLFRQPLPVWEPDNVHLDSSGKPDGNTSGAGCLKVLYRFQRCFGCRERRDADAGRERREHVRSHPHWLWMPGSCAFLYR